MTGRHVDGLEAGGCAVILQEHALSRSGIAVSSVPIWNRDSRQPWQLQSKHQSRHSPGKGTVALCPVPVWPDPLHADLPCPSSFVALAGLPPVAEVQLA